MKHVSLGPLEQEVMGYIWKKKTCTARDIWKCLGKDREIAYNTVQTIMTRLVDKKLLKRKLKGRTYVYKPAVEQKSILASLVNQTMKKLVNLFGEEEVLIVLVDEMHNISEETRRKLIKKLQEK